MYIHKEDLIELEFPELLQEIIPYAYSPKTAERIAELRRLYPRGAYSPNRKHHPFGHIAYSTIDINELIDQVATGAIQRGGTQAKFVVSLDGNDVVIRLFGAAKK